jgi:hypothetical protein
VNHKRHHGEDVLGLLWEGEIDNWLKMVTEFKVNINLGGENGCDSVSTKNEQYFAPAYN